MLSPLSVIISTSELISNRDDQSGLDRNQIVSIGQEIHHAAGLLLRSIQNYMLFIELEAIQADPKRLHVLRESRVFSAWMAITEMAAQKARQETREDDLFVAVDDSPLAMSEMYLQRIVEELLDNAFRSSPVGSKVDLKGEVHPEHHQYMLRVCDHGRGMPPEQVAVLAGKVQPGSLISNHTGQDIGLVIVKRLVELHQGSFSIQSQPKQSTIVEITIPLTE
jgi:signal transduction histidine kinase